MCSPLAAEEASRAPAAQIGEGGYSFVYLVRELGGAGASFAAKKVLCQSAEQLEEARTELAAMERFRHPNLLELLAHETIREEGRGTRTAVYFLTPAYLEGSLMDWVEGVKGGSGGGGGGGR